MALKFFWRCEGTTLDGTHDFTAGDNAATLSSTAAINTDAARIGTNGLDIPSSNDAAEFTISSNDLISTAGGSAAFSFRVTTWGNGAVIFTAVGTAGNDHIRVELGTTDELIFRHRVSGTSNLTLTTTAANIATGTWYSVVIRWDPSAEDRRIEVYDDAGSLIQAVEDTTTAFGPQTDLIALRIGETAGVACDVHIDNVFIADTYAEALEDFLHITSYTEYGVAAGGEVSWTPKHDLDKSHGPAIAVRLNGAMQ